ncbi:MAG: DUF6073 family protein [Acidobacteriota bacterium]
MSKKIFTCVAVLALAAVALMGVFNVSAAPEAADNDAKVASLVNEMNGIDADRLDALRPLAVRQYEIPADSVDVMRARISETYVIDGIGEDTVELSGWIAVKHYDARPIEGATELTWNTLVVDTEFLAMELSGTSDLFGPVSVSLDTTTPLTGQVGQIEIPEYAEVALLAELEKDASTDGAVAETTTSIWEPGSCVAVASVNIEMPNLDLSMQTASPVYWYSLVDTIPPVGHTASIAIEAVRLSDNGREVGTLKGGKVHFREVVRQVYLDDNAIDRFADAQ